MPSASNPSTQLLKLSAFDLISRLLAEAPQRKSGSPGEYAAQKLLAEEFQKQGLEIEWQPFRYSNNLYSVLALHYAVAVAGSAMLLVQPWIAVVLHGLAVVSFILDAHYWGFWLRRLLGYVPSQNLIARMPAMNPLRKRVVFISHADAAPTGWLFQPLVLYTAHVAWPNWLWILRKQMLWSMICIGLMAGLDVAHATVGLNHWGWYAWYAILTLTSFVPLGLLLQLLWNNRIVPGANDNLSGCAALILLAERLSRAKPEDVEYVFVVTGCEEAGRGGSYALSRAMRREWSTANTIVLGIDDIGGGDLRYNVEGELVPIFPSRKLRNALATASESIGLQPPISAYHQPAGSTDAIPFACLGYDSICLVGIDPKEDLPPNYHLPSDDLAHVDCQKIEACVAYAERLTQVLSE